METDCIVQWDFRGGGVSVTDNGVCPREFPRQGYCIPLDAGI
jgi:hypothetical protein